MKRWKKRATGIIWISSETTRDTPGGQVTELKTIRIMYA